jgi:hypothetical protein
VELRVVFLDAGQGDCTLVVFPSGELMLVDCGSTKNRTVVAPKIAEGIQRYLVNRGHIDLLVMTHADEDHYNLLVPVMAELGNPNVERVRYGCDIGLYKNKNEADAAYDWLQAHNPEPFGPAHFGATIPTTYGTANSPDEAKLYVLAANSTGFPTRRTSKPKNTNSVVLMVEYCRYKVFLMGDATRETEQFILDRAHRVPGLLQRTYKTSLKMGHHGSITSSGRPWVSALEPDAFFISADTKPFGWGGTGMPTFAFLQEVLSWSPNVREEVEHGVVAYYEAPENRFNVWQTKKTVYSTLKEILYDHLGVGYDAGGGSWHLTVQWGGAVDVSDT